MLCQFIYRLGPDEIAISMFQMENIGMAQNKAETWSINVHGIEERHLAGGFDEEGKSAEIQSPS